MIMNRRKFLLCSTLSMRINLFLLVSFLSSYSSTTTMNEISIELMRVHKTDEYQFFAPTWVPTESGENDAIDEKNYKKSELDQLACIEEHNETEFYEKTIAVAYLIRCMNLKGWRWHEEELIIMKH